MSHVDQEQAPEASRVPADTARQRVLAQHLELRRLLTIGLEQIRGWRAGKFDHSPLRTLIFTTRRVFLQHLEDEEGLIFPILEADLPVGPLRLKQIREEHARQRHELQELWGWPEGSSEDALALRFDRLAVALLEDIIHEERDVITPDVIRDDCIVIDQAGG